MRTRPDGDWHRKEEDQSGCYHDDEHGAAWTPSITAAINIAPAAAKANATATPATTPQKRDAGRRSPTSAVRRAQSARTQCHQRKGTRDHWTPAPTATKASPHQPPFAPAIAPDNSQPHSGGDSVGPDNWTPACRAQPWVAASANRTVHVDTGRPPLSHPKPADAGTNLHVQHGENGDNGDRGGIHILIRTSMVTNDIRCKAEDQQQRRKPITNIAHEYLGVRSHAHCQMRFHAVEARPITAAIRSEGPDQRLRSIRRTALTSGDTILTWTQRVGLTTTGPSCSRPRHAVVAGPIVLQQVRRKRLPWRLARRSTNNRDRPVRRRGPLHGHRLGCRGGTTPRDHGRAARPVSIAVVGRYGAERWTSSPVTGDGGVPGHRSPGGPRQRGVPGRPGHPHCDR